MAPSSILAVDHWRSPPSIELSSIWTIAFFTILFVLTTVLTGVFVCACCQRSNRKKKGVGVGINGEQMTTGGSSGDDNHPQQQPSTSASMGGCDGGNNSDGGSGLSPPPEIYFSGNGSGGRESGNYDDDAKAEEYARQAPSFELSSHKENIAGYKFPMASPLTRGSSPKVPSLRLMDASTPGAALPPRSSKRSGKKKNKKGGRRV